MRARVALHAETVLVADRLAVPEVSRAGQPSRHRAIVFPNRTEPAGVGHVSCRRLTPSVALVQGGPRSSLESAMGAATTLPIEAISRFAARRRWLVLMSLPAEAAKNAARKAALRM